MSDETRGRLVSRAALAALAGRALGILAATIAAMGALVDAVRRIDADALGETGEAWT